ncbi:hypothetical protein Hrd1104_01755 [Halorhabdus sp. CBA1104]|uniref:DUF7095 family protein n=1 Tax=unclassified Halorhabdus TaxID=2621901 RepID=UPI0012B1D959|nr:MULTISPECIES: hypothetical protein [unclassified Halorhabdus]QGN06145.1 hypothetical protein Hrd1104_01755 [Halorhabdus sp. CBA1104]
MSDFDRDVAVDRLEGILEAVEQETMPVPVREVWVYGDLALGLDPVERLDVYLTKDLLFGQANAEATALNEKLGVEGIGETVRTEWARDHPDEIAAAASGHVAPEQCLAAHLTEAGEPVHLEVCNASFEDNVTRRLEGALARGSYEEILDPRGVCLWHEGTRSSEALEKLRTGEYVFPTLAEALKQLGADEQQAATAAQTLGEQRERERGVTVRGDVH